MSIFLTSDLHFHHRRICEFTERGRYTDAQQHTEWLIDIWNSQVNPGDIVWHLGDFSFAKSVDDIRDVLIRLNGQKYFIKGNHCKAEHYRQMRNENLIQWFGDYREIRIKEHSTCLFHFPIVSWHRQGYGSFHCHGHCHSNLKSEHINGRMLDVGLDNAYELFGQHRLFSEQDVVDYMLSKKIYIADHHKDRTGEL